MVSGLRLRAWLRRSGSEYDFFSGSRFYARDRVDLMKTTALLLILVCALSGSVSSQERSQSSAASLIRDLERERAVAQSRNDNRALDIIFDNALVYIEFGKL